MEEHCCLRWRDELDRKVKPVSPWDRLARRLFQSHSPKEVTLRQPPAGKERPRQLLPGDSLLEEVTRARAESWGGAGSTRCPPSAPAVGLLPFSTLPQLPRANPTAPQPRSPRVTTGQEDYDRLRPLSYQNTHLVLICYDVMNPTSYDNVLIKWFPEVTHFCRGTPVVLVGCKTDLRKDKEQLRKLRAAQLEPITYLQGLSTCEQIRAALYLECSAKFRENVEDVFREAAKVALSALKKAQRRKHHPLCLLL
ncbi:rho-related GTP-binding protein RhoF isoform X1 [Artibeus jamaicensis]|uniref:rho-related GTP-binding protein RhoF isoform X1 n=1 Tax=Artibeus jamaicensis TaxID=9417 RepID=UPI00235B119D|nr:rho-related GTP-binding protein RhoF isoform X1 [Artibeus jamaicensis]